MSAFLIAAFVMVTRDGTKLITGRDLFLVHVFIKESRGGLYESRDGITSGTEQ